MKKGKPLKGPNPKSIMKIVEVMERMVQSRRTGCFGCSHSFPLFRLDENKRMMIWCKKTNKIISEQSICDVDQPLDLMEVEEWVQ